MIMLYDAVVIVALLMAAAAVPMLFGMANYTAAKDPAYTLYLITVWFLYLGWCWRNLATALTYPGTPSMEEEG